EWYTNAQPGQLIVSKGKFDYGTDNDGLISLPNKNPYWHYFRNKTMFRRQHNQYQNQYDGTEKIFLYSGLNDGFATPMPNLATEAGFTDIFTANIDGKYEEEVIKVNNTVSGNYDRLQFKVYTVNLYTGLALKNTWVFNFSTVLQDNDKNKSVHPKFHFTGDFDGDGKIEVLSVSNNHPFGWADKPGRCYLFDLETGTKLYEGAPFTFHKEFVGTRQGDAAAAAQNSDRLFAFDYDGDGKTDICLINDNGTYIYTFDVTGST
ncbi:VCBS repeat-containing protein, partial [Proteiniphilum sp. X52]|uniref:FG-GAP repeat domain-containing protein n=1 Tax=Proteiniphilum sp. X52 TaxID=2382159 RepID=UPI000F40827D